LKTPEFFKRKDRGKIVGIVAGIFFVTLLYWSGEVPAKKVPAVSKEKKELIAVEVHQLKVDPTSLQPVVLLADPLKERALIIWIGPFEANAIQAERQGTKHHRPLTHDLLEQVIRKINGKIQRVIITHSQDGIYYATLILEAKGTIMEIDARPSDSIVMALKFKAPIFVSKNLFLQMAVPLGDQKEVEEHYGLTIQELTPLLAQSFSFASAKGVVVSDVKEGSPAEKDGVRRGDIFVEIGGEAVGDIPSLKGALARATGSVPARIFRQGKFLSLTLHLK